MIQVLDRAFDILEYIATRPTEPKGLGEIAEATGINAATCARILKTMVARSYVEQIGRKKGYLVGPMAYSIVMVGPYRRDIIAAARPNITRLVSRINENALIGVRHGNRRFSICHIDAEREVRVGYNIHDIFHLYYPATGKILFSFMTDEEREAFIAEEGLPSEDFWAGTQTREDLDQVVEKIRKDCFCEQYYGSAASVAMPIYYNGRVEAALAVYLPEHRYSKKHRQEIHIQMKMTAKAIGEDLENRNWHQ